MEKLITKITQTEIIFGNKEVLQVPELSIYENERIGIVGKNGSGKTSLLRLIAGELVPGKGRVQREVDFSYFPQKGLLEMNADMDWGLLAQLQVPIFELESLSGGEAAKYRLAATLSDYRPAMLLDEPTTHLDQKGIDKLIEELTHYYGTLLFVSHDRYFLDHLAEKIWEVEAGQTGNYSDYRQQKTAASFAQEQAAQNYQQEKQRLEKSLKAKEQQAARLNRNSRKQTQRNTRPDRLSSSKQKDTVQKNLQKTAQVLAGRIERLTPVTGPPQTKKITFPVPESLALHNPFPIRGAQLRLEVGEKQLLESADFQFGNGKKIAIIGPNGSGKTTLLNSIIDHAPGIVISPKAQFSIYRQFAYQINSSLSVLAYLIRETAQRETNVRSLLHHLGFQQTELDKPMAVLSGGETTRIALALAFLRPANILIMDEPTNFIDVVTIEALQRLIANYSGLVIFTSHDSYFVESVADEVYRIAEKKLVREY